MARNAFPIALLIAPVMLLAAGCSVFEKEPPPERDHLAEIAGHADTFTREAQQRGIDISAAMATIRFEIQDDIVYEGTTLCGFAPWYDDPNTTERTITIAVNADCWLDRDAADNEALVFHELGHMVLDRFHRDDRLPNNSYASLMVSRSTAGFYVGNAANRRTYYLDELFDEETPAPDWALD